MIGPSIRKEMSGSCMQQPIYEEEDDYLILMCLNALQQFTRPIQVQTACCPDALCASTR